MSEDRRPRHPNRLKELREERGWTQIDVAERVGFPQPTYNRHERGNRGLDGTAIDRYARLFGVSPFALFVDPATLPPDLEPEPETMIETWNRVARAQGVETIGRS